ncbi:MAG: ribbon-helix-helix protein, CopG family [Deltaproteobacteria bacterium]|nr:ribbon-helix-helix protein, CopG family [Deltaproteobacteria bacterium]
MRTNKAISITLPPAILAKAQRIAKKENRTMSELIREALRRYQREQEWDALNAYGRSKARALGVTKRDVVGIVKQYRRERRPKLQAGKMNHMPG